MGKAEYKLKNNLTKDSSQLTQLFVLGFQNDKMQRGTKGEEVMQLEI